MKKYLLICAGALILTAACKEEEFASPQAYSRVAFSSPPTALQATPELQTFTYKVAQTAAAIDYVNDKNLTVTIQAEWNTDDQTVADKGKITAKLGEQTIADGKATITVTIPAGQNDATFTITTTGTQTMRSSNAAKLSIRITKVEGAPSIYDATTVSVTIKGDSPLATAPSYAMLLGRKCADTLWFGINKKYYTGNDAPTINDFTVGVKKNSESYANATNFTKIDSISKGKVGIVIPYDDATRNGWVLDDAVSIRLTLSGSTADVLTVAPFTVQADKLAKSAKYDFKNITSYFALFAGKEVTAKDTVAARTDIVFYLDTMTTRTDSTFVLKVLESDSCKIAVIASDSASYAENLRTDNGVQEKDGDFEAPANTIAIPSGADEYINITKYQYYAVKITVGTGDNTKTHYGYLRLKTFFYHGAYYEGEAPNNKLERVEFSLNYGAARDYEKE
jgi:hypothetical protein